MSHCPGSKLEDWITDAWSIVDADGAFGTSIRRTYQGQLILTREQFLPLVAIYEPARELVEQRLEEYSEEEYGSWRDYRNFAFDGIPEEIGRKAEAYVRELSQHVPKTEGLA